MIEVCVDQAGGGTWMFDEKSKIYSRVEPEKGQNAVIAGKFLPDPDALWQERLDMYDVARNSTMGQKLRPSAATFALWNHWRGVQGNADSHI